ncbi:MAG: hypothetical protein H0V26_13935, partial [Solirubrobacterales bacterium]|nr:hypothetical protein [Solirubrobacterales bacterium]
MVITLAELFLCEQHAQIALASKGCHYGAVLPLLSDSGPIIGDRLLDECLSIRDGHLFMEQCDVVELANRYGTPLHLLSADQLRRRFELLTRAFTAAWPEGPVELLPSVKASFTAAAWRLL